MHYDMCTPPTPRDNDVLKNIYFGVWEMAWQLTALAALAEDPVSAPTHMVANIHL